MGDKSALSDGQDISGPEQEGKRGVIEFSLVNTHLRRRAGDSYTYELVDDYKYSKE